MLGTGCLGETSQLSLCYVFTNTHLITALSFETITSVSFSYQICCHSLCVMHDYVTSYRSAACLAGALHSKWLLK
jgi:hypothetical protein